MEVLIRVLIYFGSALMVYNIIRYYGFLKHVNKMESLGETRRVASVPITLLVCFLAGYLFVGFLGKPDIVMALILSGGSVYVSLVLMVLYRIVEKLEENEIRLGSLYEESRNNLNELTKNALSVFRVNLTRDKIEERGGTGLYESDLHAKTYTEMIEARKENLLIEKHALEESLFTHDNLIRYFMDGHTTAEEVLFCRNAANESCFVRFHATLAVQPATGDITAFITEILYNDEMVADALLTKALSGQYDMIGYLVDGQYGIVIGDSNPHVNGLIMPDSNHASYNDFIQNKLAPILSGSEEENAKVLNALGMKAIEQNLSESEPYVVNLSCRINDDSYYKRFVFYTVDPEAHFYLLLLADTTEARREELEKNLQLQAALDDAKKASAAKTVFLSNMSHDIRTPMNAIIGYTNLAKRKDNSPEQIMEYLDKIDSSNQYLLALINDVLEMSRIESGKLELEPGSVDLCEMLDEVREMFTSQMTEKRIHFEVSYDDMLHSHVLCDKNRLNRVLLNLLSNAYKFTPEEGQVSVSLTSVSLTQNACEQDGFGSYELRVSDNGIGMSEEFARHVFDAFERERNTTVSGIQGTGLGMAITKSIVDLMGGTILVETAPNKGTTFIIQLTLQLQDDIARPDKKRKKTIPDAAFVCDFTKIHVLLVEDNIVNRKIATLILRDMGFMIDTAENGKIAVDKVAASDPGHYGLILMDIQMPTMNGYDATRMIRSMSDPVLSQIPIIAMTANAFNEDIREAENAGMNGHIAKPLDVEVMKKTIKTVLLEASVS